MVSGIVQGVGFRPYVFRLAEELSLAGWVKNTPAGVVIEVEGRPAQVDEFRKRLPAEKPRHCEIQQLDSLDVPPCGYSHFAIRSSDKEGAPTALVPTDIATCGECLAEIFDPANRRYLYPFTNCTHCGPRFSILEALPYDRANTSMRAFTMCAKCHEEYEDPSSRRFHAQPNACAACGPQLELWDSTGATLQVRQEALLAAVEALRDGAIVALKGLGGFHLFADASNADTIRRLRDRKGREEKPLAVMFASLQAVREHCEISTLEESTLCDPASPIVLLRKRGQALAPNVAPGNPCLGALLPYTPLHHVFMRAVGSPLVATSGNLSGKPLCTDERVALSRLSVVADFFLIHNRPIVRHVDDSIVQVVAGRTMLLRRARGFTPLPIRLPVALPPTLAVGAHSKNTIALAVGHHALLSQHLGDFETPEALTAFRRTIDDFNDLYRTSPREVVADAHPDYASSTFAHGLGLPVRTVQHHIAHILSCMTENELQGPALGVAWDGTGFGNDGTVWGGEFFRVTKGGIERFAHLRTFPLPGGEIAARELRRSAIGVLYELFGDAALATEDELPPVRTLTKHERNTVGQMLRRGFQSPRTSSAGRLFDAVAALLDLRRRVSFEGQAAMDLEFAIDSDGTRESYEMPLTAGGIVDWAPAILGVLADTKHQRPVAMISVKFHRALVESLIQVARRANEQCVVLSGGCFQNRFLSEYAIHRLREEGFTPYWHQLVPPNDGGVALGQLAAAARDLQSSCA